jgi:hypothetical protein
MDGTFETLKNRHISEAEVEQYSMSTLPEWQLALVEEHLLICEFCQNRVTQSDAYVVSMQDAALELREERTEAPKARFTAGLAPVFGLAAMGLVGAAVWTQHTSKRDSPDPPLPVYLQAVRGAGAGSVAPARRRLVLHPDLTGLPVGQSYRLELVNSTGGKTWQGSGPEATLPPLPPGMYFLRGYSASGELVREYGLELSSR